jgi:hypothetical protein
MESSFSLLVANQLHDRLVSSTSCSSFGLAFDMVGHITPPGEGRRLLVFGPQALSLNAAASRALQSTIMQISNKEWICNAIADLPSCWEAFVEEFPKYQVLQGAQTLTKLTKWLKTGNLEHQLPHLPNIILSPLVIITHITEYLKYLDAASPESRPQESSTEILGFCMGFLSALAVAISKDRREIEAYGATVIRLAMLIGGVVDAQGMLDSQGLSKSFATAWTSSEAAAEMDRILKGFPEVNKPVPSCIIGSCEAYRDRRMFPSLTTSNGRQ